MTHTSPLILPASLLVAIIVCRAPLHVLPDRLPTMKGVVVHQALATDSAVPGNMCRIGIRQTVRARTQIHVPPLRVVAALAYRSPAVHHRDEDTPLQRKKAIELHQKWGGKPCDHPTFSREYDLGERTGNYCCTQCGASLTFREKAQLVQSRDAKRDNSRPG